MNSVWKIALLASGMLVALTGCDRPPGTTTGESTTGPIATQAAKTERVFNDASITAAVSAGLAKDPDLSAIKIDVDTQGGRVTLHGPAPNEAAKARAESIAKSVDGVVAVDNKLEVKAM